MDFVVYEYGDIWGPISYPLLLLHYLMECNETFTESLYPHCASHILDFDQNQFGGQKVHVIKWGVRCTNLMSIAHSFSSLFLVQF